MSTTKANSEECLLVPSSTDSSAAAASTEPLHVDDWLDRPSLDEGECYAKFVLDYKRMPAWKIYAYEKWMAQFKLFCTYEGARYRCTGASRMGDVWLTADFGKEHGYEKRVDVLDCTNWGDKP